MAEIAKRWITFKSITWFLIALVAMSCYFLLIDWGLMEVQGLDFFYLWNTGGGN